MEGTEDFRPLVPSTGPEVDGITDGGKTRPNRVLRVVRLNCARKSARGSQAALAKRTMTSARTHVDPRYAPLWRRSLLTAVGRVPKECETTQLIAV